MAFRDTALARHVLDFMGNRVVPLFSVVFRTPDHYTWLGFFLAVAAPVGFWFNPAWGFLCIGLSALADIADGQMAKRLGMTSTWGAFLDSSLDRASDFFYLAGFWVLFWESPYLLLATALVFTTFLFSVMVSYTKARAESLGAACNAGLLERGYRTLLFAVWAFLLAVFPPFRTPILWTGLILLFVLTFYTVVQRM
ncbi:MAG: CDP-alcohol phosphatidyltransferase family protein, partial [Deltaproteobacteria bacterium]|nr:CDP-alcohol phosphatidyltransferase family protein [Deltaproteobacteria bacterium]